MGNVRVMAAALALLVLALSPAFAADAPVAPTVPAVVAVGTDTDKAGLERDVDKLLALTEVDVDLAFIHDGEVRLLEAGKDNGAIPKVSWLYLDDALKTAFAPARLKRIVRQSFIAHIDPVQLPGMLAWYGSDLGRKITAAQNSVLNRAGEKELFAYRDNPQSAPPGETRLKILRQIDGLTQTSVNHDLILQNMQKIFVDGFTFYKKNSAADVEKISKLIAENRAKTPQRVILSMAFVYRELSDDELGLLVQFLESAPGKNFIAVANLTGRALWADVHNNHLLLMMGQMIGKLDPP